MANKITIRQKTKPREATYVLTIKGKKIVLTEAELQELKEEIPDESSYEDAWDEE